MASEGFCSNRITFENPGILRADHTKEFPQPLRSDPSPGHCGQGGHAAAGCGRGRGAVLDHPFGPRPLGTPPHRRYRSNPGGGDLGARRLLPRSGHSGSKTRIIAIHRILQG